MGVGRRGPPLEGRGLARVGRNLGDGPFPPLLRLGLDLLQSDEPLRRRVERQPNPAELAVAQGSHFYHSFFQILGVARVPLPVDEGHVLLK